MNHLHAQELIRDFIRFRQNGYFGWPDASVYPPEDMAYFQMLERERIAGRLEIQGEADYPRSVFNASRKSPGWHDIYEAHDEADQKEFLSMEVAP